MKTRAVLPLIMILVAGIASSQSLSEVAKKEKERRRKLKEEGEQIHVITEEELKAAGPESTQPVESSETSGSSQQTDTRSTARPTSESGVGGAIPNEIPRDAPLRDRIAIFERMLSAHRAEVQRIDEEIAKNNARIEEIQQKLNTIGAGGLPVAPTAPTVDRSVRYEGEAAGLQSEQQELRQENRALETRKRRLADELRQKGRRAGIPAGYLRF